jgi:FtsP/CotA-like multicopper oxidase with cupredoxin domain
MTKKRILTLIGIALVMISLPMGIGLARSTQSGKADLLARQERLQKTRITTAQRRAAAARFKQLRQNQLSKALASGAKMTTLAAATALAGVYDPSTPHYFGPYPNYANSPLPAGPIFSVDLVSGGSGYSSPIVVIDDLYGQGSGATATAQVVQGAVTRISVVDPGIGYMAPIVYVTDPTGTGADATAAIGPGPAGFVGGIRKFVDGLPGLNLAGTNNLGQYIPVAIPDTAAYPGDDYYEIELGQYSERLHSDLPPTLLRGYRQTNTGDATVGQFHYLGPLIVAQRDRPVRVKFTNNLPTGMGGNLFIPVDTTVMGAGMGPTGAMYTENRATLHLHGGFVPWISDGTPHQWTTPAGDSAAYPTGVSVYNVPDMPNPGANPLPGELTFYYNNQQSARLMFYHDHAFGITRLNVYAGEAAGYVITDAVEQDLINGTNNTGVNPGLLNVLPDVGIPLVIQDKTFVDPLTIYSQDPTWKWGSGPPGTANKGDLWMPHVYMPNQNPGDLSGMNAFGRWHYGPWFWPPTNLIAFPPVANPYVNTAPWEYSLVPATPNPSMAMEAFMDTPLINGTAYPVLNVDPKTYRFRILSVCNDRFMNLQLYVADPQVNTWDGRSNTEVRMVPAVQVKRYPAGWPKDGREGGVPDPDMTGPSFIQIGTEGGFLPAPVVVSNQPIDWNLNPTTFNFGNISSHALLLGPAERADVLVDFSAFAGETLILYNDAPAAFPALDTRYDYYTGNPDQTGGGGAPSTQVGYGPNTRTIMQINVGRGGAAAAYNLAALEQVFAKTGVKNGVFEVSQDPIIVPTDVYNSAYNKTFPHDQYARIFESSKTFVNLDLATLTIPFQPKAIQDEMGEAFDTEYGRMSGFLGVQLPATAGGQRFTLFPYASPPVEIVTDSMTPMTPVAGDGTQIWKITQNGVDTHTLHFHLFNVQLVNRVAWDNAVILPDANELGWKETVRVNPLEDTIVALRPYAPTLPFDVPNSYRPIDVTKPVGVELMGGPTGFKDPLGNPVMVFNNLVNWGWEYVLHCHLLGHEEMDMMHGMGFVVAPNPPTDLSVGRSADGISIDVAWTDTSANETGFTIQRAEDNAFTAGFTEISMGSNVVAYTDAQVNINTTYYYRVFASNVVGDIDTPGFPITVARSGFSNTAMLGANPIPADPTTLTASLQAGPSVLLSWTDNAANETGFVVERAANGGAFAEIATPGPLAGTGTVTYTDSTVSGGITYSYRVKAVNGSISSGYSNTADVTLPDILAAPSNVTATGVPRNNNRSRINVAWADNSTNETGFTLQYATSIDFTTGVVTINLPANTTTYQTGNLPRNTSYYVRVRSVNGTLPSLWVNATPFPVITP